MATVIDELITVLTFRGDATGIQNTRQRLRGMSDDINSAATGLGILGGAITAISGVALGFGISWETAFTDVLKTVNGTDEELAIIEARLREMAKLEVPLAAEDLAAIAASAGQLGIATPAITGFTRVIADLSATTNLAAEQGAQDLARFANITQMSQEDFDRLGATIVHLGNNFATTEAEIVSMSLRLAGSGSLIGLTEAQMLSLATGLTSVGINAEAGGTAFSRVFADMQKAVQTGGEELHLYNQLLGKDFATLFEAAPDQAVVEFIGALQGMIDSGGNVHLVLEELGFDSERIRDSLLRSAGAGDLMADALNQGTQAWEENIALTREAALRYETSASQIQFAKNQAKDLAITAGETLAPSLIKVLDALTPMIEGFAEFVKEHPRLVEVVAIFGGGLLALSGTLFVVSGAMRVFAFSIAPVTGLVNFLRSGTLLLRVQLFLLAIQEKATAAATWLLNTAMLANPVGLIALAVLGLIGAFVGLSYMLRDQTNWWQYIRATIGGVWDVIQAFLLPIWRELVSVWRNDLQPAILELAQMFGVVDASTKDTSDQMEQLIAHMATAARWAGYLGGSVAKDLSKPFRLLADAIREVNSGLEALKSIDPGVKQAIIQSVRSVIGFAEGGEVPGPEGQPVPAVVHGGETVLPVRVTRMLRESALPDISQMLANLQLGPEALAPALPPPAPAFGGGGQRSYTVEVGGITVHVGAGADGEEIAATIARHLSDQIEDLVADFDGPIAR